MDYSLDILLKKAKGHFNKREYEQFIHPICLAYEKQDAIITRQKVNGVVNNITSSVMVALKEQTESIDDKEYVLLDKVEELIKRELSVYTI